MSHYIDIDDVKFPNIATFNMKLSGKQAVMVRLEELKMIPAADVRPAVHAHWNEFDESTWECSNCGQLWTLYDGTPKQNNMNHCPACGADMREDKQG